MDSGLLFRGDHPASTITNRVNRGELVRLAPGVYTTDVVRDPAAVVRDHLFEIVRRLMPDGIVTDRSARTGTAVDGVSRANGSRQDDPSVYVKAMRYAHDFTASVDFSAYGEAKRQLTDANAFEDPDSAHRLQILGRRPAAAQHALWRQS